MAQLNSSKRSGICTPHTRYLPHLGVPTHSTFLYPRPARVSSRKWELRSVNRYWALLFLLSRGRSTTLGLPSWAAVTAVDRWEEWASCSPGRSRIWQSWQNFFSSSRREANFLNLRDKSQYIQLIRSLFVWGFWIWTHQFDITAILNRVKAQFTVNQAQNVLSNRENRLSPLTVLLVGEQGSLWLVLCFSGQKPGLRHL